MMFNQRPIDPHWCDMAGELTKAMSKALDSCVLVIAAKQGAKMGIFLEGDDLPGDEIAAMRACLKNIGMPGLLRYLADVVEVHEAAAQPKTVVFDPGCFDDFEGTPEELQDVIAQIHQSVADGTMLAQGRPMTEEELVEVGRRVAEAAKRRARPQ